MREHVIWIVIKATSAAIPWAWRHTQEEAEEVAIRLRTTAAPGEYFFIAPVSDIPGSTGGHAGNVGSIPEVTRWQCIECRRRLSRERSQDGESPQTCFECRHGSLAQQVDGIDGIPLTGSHRR